MTDPETTPSALTSPRYAIQRVARACNPQQWRETLAFRVSFAASGGAFGTLFAGRRAGVLCFLTGLGLWTWLTRGVLEENEWVDGQAHS